jgi:hypothetical protein
VAERISIAERKRSAIVAERAIAKYAGDHAMWHKYIHNVELDPVQVLKMNEMDRDSKTIDFSSRRTGKTAVKELYLLEWNACNSDQELGIVAPRLAQAQVNLKYHLEAVQRSPQLEAYLAVERGRRQISETRYRFANRSSANAFGIMANADGGDLTTISLEEVDDMPKERLYSRFLLMLGSTRRMGASNTSSNKPQVRITGVFKGADTLTELLNGGNYGVIGALHGPAARAAIQKMIDLGEIPKDAVEIESYNYPLPIWNAMNAMEYGLLQTEYLKGLRADMSEDEYIRQLLCVNTASRNLVWELYLRKALIMGLQAGVQLEQPMPGIERPKRGVIAFGYDHLGHGEQPESSKSALVVLEMIGIYYCVIFCKIWPAGTDEYKIKNDIKSYWRYFRPDRAIGDAYGIGLITSLNDELFREGLTTVDRHAIGEGQSTAGTWGDWAFSPMRFEGMVKHQMAVAVRAMFHDDTAVLPYFEDLDMNDPDTAALRLLARQVINIRAEVTSKAYASYKMVNAKLGDDLFDALMAAVWAISARGVDIPTAVLISKKSREKLLDKKAA